MSHNTVQLGGKNAILCNTENLAPIATSLFNILPTTASCERV